MAAVSKVGWIHLSDPNCATKQKQTNQGLYLNDSVYVLFLLQINAPLSFYKYAAAQPSRHVGRNGLFLPASS